MTAASSPWNSFYVPHPSPTPHPLKKCNRLLYCEWKKSFCVLPRASACFRVLAIFLYLAFLSFCIASHYFSTLWHTFSMFSTFSQQIASALTLLLSWNRSKTGLVIEVINLVEQAIIQGGKRFSNIHFLQSKSSKSSKKLGQR